MYCKLQLLLIRRDHNEVLKFYGDDFEKDTLLAQLDLLHYPQSLDQSTSVHDIAK